MNPSGVGARPKRHEELGGGSTVTTREDIEVPLAKIHVLKGQYDEVQPGVDAVQNGLIRALGPGSEFIAHGGMLLGPASQYERAETAVARAATTSGLPGKGAAMNILYTTAAVVEGGRAGHGRTSDGRLAVELSVPTTKLSRSTVLFHRDESLIGRAAAWLAPTVGAIVAAAWLAGAGPALAVDTASRLEVANRLTEEAESYVERDNYTRAEPLLQAALLVAETAVGPTDPRIIRNLNVLAELYLAERRHADAEPLLQRSLAIQEATLGAQNPKLSFPVAALARLYRGWGRLEQAEPFYSRLVEIFDRVLGPEDFHTAFALEGLAGLYAEEGKYAEAEPLYHRALPIFERVFGGDRVAIVSLLEGYARVLARMERNDEAEALRTRARAIHERAEARPRT